jgi:hypothetical protein
MAPVRVEIMSHAANMTLDLARPVVGCRDSLQEGSRHGSEHCECEYMCCHFTEEEEPEKV